MRTANCFIAIFFTFSCVAQSNQLYSFSVKTGFELGEAHTYAVSEFFKIENLFWGVRSKVESTVSFRVVDTANGGYWLRYTVNVNSVKQNRDSSAYLLATLMDGLKLFIYAKDGRLLLDSTMYFKTKKRIRLELDSIANEQRFGKKTIPLVRYLQSALKQDGGLEALLGPFMIFKTYYSSEVYKKFRLATEGRAEDILGRVLFGGIVERELKRVEKDSSVSLNYLFTGHPVSAANYFRAVYEGIFAMNEEEKAPKHFPSDMQYDSNYIFNTKQGKSFPLYLYKKNVSEYLVRSVNKTEMREIMTAGD